MEAYFTDVNNIRSFLDCKEKNIYSLFTSMKNIVITTVLIGVETLVQGTLVQGYTCPRNISPRRHLSKDTLFQGRHYSKKTLVQGDICPK